MPENAMRLADDAGGKALPRRFTFTRARLAALRVPPGKDRIVVYDTAVPRLSFMLTAKGAASYYYVYKLNGRTRRFLIGDGTLSIEDARKATTAPAAKLANDIDPQTERQASRAEQTLATVWTWFYDTHCKPRLRTADEIQQKYDKYLKPWAGRKFNSITRSEVAALHHRIGKDRPGEPGRPGAANRLVRLVSSLFNRARDIGFSGANPASGIRMFPENRRERFLLPHELPKFFKGLKAVEQHWQDLFLLALYTGARMGNVRAMEWDEIDFTAKTWTISAEKFKTGKAVIVPLADEAIKILNRRHEAASAEARYIFPSDSASGYVEEPRKAWAAVCKASGLTDLHVHDLRHSLASWQAGLGANLSTIGRSLGHANSATTARYAHVDLSVVRKSVGTAVKAMTKASKAKQGKGR